MQTPGASLRPPGRTSRPRASGASGRRWARRGARTDGQAAARTPRRTRGTLRAGTPQVAPAPSAWWLQSRGLRASRGSVGGIGRAWSVSPVGMFLPLFAAVSVTDPTLNPGPTGSPVEGSNGLLVEVDGKIVPNYAATMVSFDEGDVVKGNVVRIDKDEVLVDIGYKSEGVIPST